jgi:AcrR family transcriptional regulator
VPEIKVFKVHYNEKQEQIIISAEKLFSEGGFSGTSVRDIAQEAKVNVAMISYYFGSKEKLLEAVFEYRILGTAIQLENIVANDKITPIHKIYSLIDHYTDKLFNNQCFYKLMLREQLKQMENADLLEIIYKSKKKNLDLISNLISEGQAKGQFRKKIDVSLMMSTLFGASNQVFFNQPFYRRINGLESMPEDEFQILLKKRLRLHLKNMFKAILTHEL